MLEYIFVISILVILISAVIILFFQIDSTENIADYFKKL